MPGEIALHALRTGVEGWVGGGEAGDLAADIGPVALVEIQQIEQPDVAGLLHVAVDEVLRQIPTIVEVEIHGEKSDVHRHVAAPQPVVELDAVEDHRRILEENVPQVEIAVALASATLGDSPGKEIGIPFVKRVGPVASTAIA